MIGYGPRRVESTPILNGSTWLHIPSGAYWYETRLHRGRVILRRYGFGGPEIKLYRLADDPGTGASLLGAPTWIRRPKAEALEWMATTTIDGRTVAA